MSPSLDEGFQLPRLTMSSGAASPTPRPLNCASVQPLSSTNDSVRWLENLLALKKLVARLSPSEPHPHIPPLSLASRPSPGRATIRLCPEMPGVHQKRISLSTRLSFSRYLPPGPLKPRPNSGVTRSVARRMVQLVLFNASMERRRPQKVQVDSEDRATAAGAPCVTARRVSEERTDDLAGWRDLGS